MSITTGLELLDKNIITNHILENYNLEILQSVSSTNDYLLALVKANKITTKHYIVFAEEQTAGRGRSGKKWESPYARNLYMSFYYKFPNYAAISGLSLVVGIAVVNALRAIGLQTACIKWPNDIYCNGAKLSGLLIETSNKPKDAAIHTIIGIGVNVAGINEISSKIDQPCTDVVTSVGQNISRNLLAALVIREVMFTLEKFQQQGLAGFLAAWKELDLLDGKLVAITVADKVHHGVAVGINSRGNLCILGADGAKYYFNAGTVRLSQ